MEFGKDGFNDFIDKNKKSPIDFKIWFYSHGTDIKNEKLKFLISIFHYIAKVKSSIIREEYLKRIADYLNIDIRLILAEYGNFMNRNKNIGEFINTGLSNEKINRFESDFISMLVLNPDFLSKVDEIINIQMFQSDEIKDIYSFILQNPGKKTKEIVSIIKNDYIITCISKLAQNENLKFESLLELAYQIKFLFIKRKISDFTVPIRNTDNIADDGSGRELLAEKQILVKEASEIEKALKRFEPIE